jgi:hypothetical protein
MHEARLWPGGGTPGEDVPTVDVADLKSVWSIYRDMEARNPGKQFGVGIDIIRGACSAGADIGAVTYRCAMLGMLEMLSAERLVPWRANEFLATVLKVAATIPMKWMETGVPQSGLPFDVDAFFQEVRKEPT